jgi:hypothetical protein
MQMDFKRFLNFAAKVTIAHVVSYFVVGAAAGKENPTSQTGRRAAGGSGTQLCQADGFGRPHGSPASGRFTIWPAVTAKSACPQ